jgi:uncharacterized protein
MELYEICIAIFGLVVAGIVKGSTGLGYASCALPFLVATVGLKSAMGLVLLPAMATNLSVALSAGHFRETVTRFKWLYVSMIPGITVGITLLLYVQQSAAVTTLGVLVVSYAILALARPKLRLPQKYEYALQLPTGFINGVMTGLTGAQVMPLFPYVMSLHLDAARTVQTINLAVLIATFILGVGLILAGLVSGPLLAASLAAVIPAIIGTELGNWMRERIPAQRFRTLMLVTLFTIGTTLVLKSPA